MTQHVAHERHVNHHKAQFRQLRDNLGENEIIIQADFIQNIAHSRGRETSASYYSKRQTQFLSFVVWYRGTERGKPKTFKKHIDYLSGYLKHSSLFFSKCVTHLLTHLRDECNITFSKVRIGNWCTTCPQILTYFCRFGLLQMVAKNTSSLVYLSFLLLHCQKCLV